MEDDYKDKGIENVTIAYGKLNLYYSLIEEKNNNIVLIDITDVEDKKIGLEIIKELINDIKS